MDPASNKPSRRSIDMSPQRIYEVYELKPISKHASPAKSPVKNNGVYKTPQSRKEFDLGRTGRYTDLKSIYNYQQPESLFRIKSVK